MAEEAAPDSAPPRRQERGSWGMLVAWALPLLALGTILHTLALFLPWEHLLVCIEACAKIEAVDGPAFTVLLPSASISAAYVGILFGEASFPGLTFSVLWHTALPLTGVVLLLAYSTFGRAAMRWGILILYALWLALLSANAISFAQWLANTDQGPPTHAPQGGVASWLAYVTATGFRVYGPGLETPPSPAWGFWVLLVALGISWFAWAVALLAQWRSKASRQEARTMTSHDAAVILERPPSRLRLLSAIAITLGALLWCLGVLALVQINVDCSRPLPVTPPARATTCGAHSAFDRLQVLEQAQVAEYSQIDPGDVGAQQRYAYLGLVRDHMLLALVLVALPFALVVAWRAATRARARWLTAWWLLALAVLLVTLRAMLLVLYPNPPPPGTSIFLVKSFEESVGPAPVVTALGIVLMGLGLLGVWRRAQARAPLAARSKDGEADLG